MWKSKAFLFQNETFDNKIDIIQQNKGVKAVGQ